MNYITWEYVLHKAFFSVAFFGNLLHIFLVLVVVAIIGVAIALSCNMYRLMLRARAMRSYRESEGLSRSDKIYLGATKAEESVQEVLWKAGWKHIYLRRRIPVSRTGHNREIDLVAVGPVILVVEVKHWQGYVWSNGPRWFQMPGKMRQTLEFEDVMEDNMFKAAALRRYIENTCRIALPDLSMLCGEPKSVDTDSSIFIQRDEIGTERDGSKESITEQFSTCGEAACHPNKDIGTWYTDKTLHKQCGLSVLPIVVFTHPHVKLDPATVRAKKYVFTLKDFAVFASEALKGNISLETTNDMIMHRRRNYFTWRWPLSHCVSPFCVPSETLLTADLQRRISHVIDTLRTWDLVRLHNGRLITGDVQKIDLSTIKCTFERRHLLEINFHWNFGVMGLLKSFLWNQEGVVELVLTTSKRMSIGKKGIKTRTAKGNIVFPILPQNKKKAQNDRLTIKPVGVLKLITLALADIKEVSLSHHLYETEKNIKQLD